MTRPMTRIGLLLRNVRYFRAANLAVVVGMAVATAVLTGALLVGDSVRGSLRELALQRLGPVDHVLIAPHFFDQSLAERLATAGSSTDQFDVVPALLVRGGASDESGEHRTGGVQIAAIGGDWMPVAPDQCVINGPLAEALGMTAPGATAALQIPTPGDIPRDATLARRALDEITSRPQLRVARIATEPSLASMFNLEGGQRLPRNVWTHLATLQREVRQPGRVNLLLVKSQQRVEQLNDRLRRVLRLDDYGLKLSSGEGGEQVLSSQSTYIPPAVDEAAERAAARIGAPLRRVSVHLINNVVRVDPAGADQASIHYAVAAGISSLPDESLAEDELALNAWAAERLGAKAGDRIRLDYYERRGDGELVEVRGAVLFRVRRILPMSGLGADRTLTPDYPGLTDKASIREAPPDLGIKDELLTDEDEAYWKQYRAAPKVFVNLAVARRIWGQTYGDLTSIRIPTGHAAAFETELLKELDPAALGMAFRSIKAEQLAAASGSTDFSMLFVGLSFFLIAAAALLVAMLFRLSVESRARQFGVLGAIGFSPRTLYRLALAEGFALALVGGAIGLAGAVGYTWLMVSGLRTWWVDAIGTTALRLRVEPVTLAIGFVAGLAIAMLAVVWAARNLRREQTVRLLSGGWSAGDALPRRRAPIAAVLAMVGVIGGGGMLAAARMGILSSQAAFFGGGSLLLMACLSAAAWMLRSGQRAGATETWSLAALAIGTAKRRAARSLLTISLIALASFLLVTVAAMRQEPAKDSAVKNSGTGGYRLFVQADIPLLGNLNTAAGRTSLGMREPDAPIWSRARFISLRRWAGQDASCLNLTRPDNPTILGVPSEMIRENRFKFARTAVTMDNPWTLLEQPKAESPDDIPVIADDETARYILKLGLEQSLTIRDSSGRPRHLRLVATLAGSMFQSELLMSEANFRRLFPMNSGFGVALVETDSTHAGEIARRLGQELDAFAITVDPTADRLAAYKQVANTYLSTFQTLGSLGLLLGTIGLAVVLLRGVIERRSELALLSAIGFAPARRIGLVLTENIVLLIAGLLAGTLCALVAVLPAVISAGRSIHYSGLAAALAAVLLSGLVVMTAAAWFGGRTITPADLRRE